MAIHTAWAAPAPPVALAPEVVGPFGFEAQWLPSVAADGYVLDVWRMDEDFSDGNVTTNPVWSGDTAAFELLTAATLPGGAAATDGAYLGSVAATNDVLLIVPSDEVAEWRFSLGTPSFEPSDLNYVGVVLMSDAAIAGDIADADFRGYYLRIGNNASPDPIRLYRSTGVGKVHVGSFSSPDFSSGGLQDGIQVHVTRDDGGVWRLWTGPGFDATHAATNYAGSMTDASYTTSSYFGVYQHVGSPASERRVYMDHIELGARRYAPDGEGRPVSGTRAMIGGLAAWADYAYAVRATNLAGEVSPDSNLVSVRTAPATPAVGPAASIGATGFHAVWEPVQGAFAYRLEVFAANEDFNDGDGALHATWVGDTDAFGVTNLAALPAAEQAGALDVLLDGDGIVTTGFATGTSAQGEAVVLQSDGRMVVAGSSFNGVDQDVGVVRYQADGAVDQRFGVGGTVTFDLGGAEAARALAVQPNGLLLVAGESEAGDGRDVFVLRLHADGALDSSFGTDGTVRIGGVGGDADVRALALQSDGGIVLLAVARNGVQPAVMLIRYRADGTLDPSFGSGGQRAIDWGAMEDARDLALQPDGRILVGGAAGGDVAVVRCEADGAADDSFGTGGMATHDFGGSDGGGALVLQRDGGMVLAGETDGAVGLVRFNPDGTLDESFGDGGAIATYFSGQDSVRAIALQADGRIVVGGTVGFGSDADFGVTRYERDGALDRSFGTQGRVTTDFGGGADDLRDLAIGAEGRLVAVGKAWAGHDVFGIARYHGTDGRTDGCFLASKTTTADAALMIPSDEVHEWMFALGTPDFNPSDLNWIGVVLMSDTALSGDIASAEFRGYYLRLGDNGAADRMRLYRSTGVGKEHVGTFQTPNWGAGALKQGVSLRVTREDNGVFELFYAEGFTYAPAAAMSAGRITNTVCSSSSYFGVVTHFSQAGSGRQIFVDNVMFGTRPEVVNGYDGVLVADPPCAVNGLDACRDYYYRVCAVLQGGETAASTIQAVRTPMVAPIAIGASGIGPHGFAAQWMAVPGARSYRLDVLETDEDFSDGDAAAKSAWSGDTAAFEVLDDTPVPGGNAAADGRYLGCRADTGGACLSLPCTETRVWRFSLASPNFNPSTVNSLAVVLMASALPSGSLRGDADFQGYYLKLGDAGSEDDQIELWRKTGSGEVEIGSFNTPDFDPGALRDGLNIKVTRDAAGVFRLWYDTGFRFDAEPATYAGALTNAVYNQSSWFGVCADFDDPSAMRRVYIDNIVFGDRVEGYADRFVTGTNAVVNGLKADTTYFYQLRAVFPDGVSADSNLIRVDTLSGASPPMGTLFKFY